MTEAHIEGAPRVTHGVFSRLRWVLLCLLVASPASANPEAERQVQQLGQRAAKKFAAGDHVAALQAFRDAESWLAKLPERRAELALVRYNIGVCLEKLARPMEALDAFESITVADLPGRTRAGHPKRVRELVSTLFGEVTVTCGQARVEVRGLTGERVCGDTWPRVVPGRYQVVASYPSGASASAWTDVQAGQTARVSLTPSVAPPPAKVSASLPKSNALAVGLAAGAGALLAGGLATHVLARGALEDEARFYDEWSETGDPFIEDQARASADEARLLAITTYALYGVSAATAVGALVVYSRDDAAPTVAVTPGGVVVRGAW